MVFRGAVFRSWGGWDRARLRLAGGVALSAAALYLSLRGLPLEEVWALAFSPVFFESQLSRFARALLRPAAHKIVPHVQRAMDSLTVLRSRRGPAAAWTALI